MSGPLDLWNFSSHDCFQTSLAVTEMVERELPECQAPNEGTSTTFSCVNTLRLLAIIEPSGFNRPLSKDSYSLTIGVCNLSLQ